MIPLLVDLEREWRGGQNQFLLTLRELRKRGHPAELVAPAGSALAERAPASGVLVHRVGPSLLQLQAALVLRALLRKGRYDVVHVNEPHALTAAWLAGAHRRAPLVVSRRVGYPLSGSKLAQMRFHAARRLIAVSRWVAENAAASGMPWEKISIVHEGVEIPGVPSAEERRRARERWGIAESTRLLGSVGVFLPDKGHEWLIRALAVVRGQFPDCRLLLAGAGPLRPQLETTARELGVGDAVLFPGFVTDVESVYAALDIFLFPSFFEGLGTSLLSAMAREIPPVAFAKGGLPEIVEHGRSGLLIPCPKGGPDVREIAAAVARILGDAEFAKRLGQAARERIVRNFSVEKMAEETLQVYREVAGNP